MTKKILNIIQESGNIDISNGARKKRLDEHESCQDVTAVDAGSKVTFEEAVRLTGHGKFNYLLLVACGLTVLGAVEEMLVVGYILSGAGCDFDLTQQNKGLFGAITYVGVIISSHMWGVLGDTLGRRRVLVYALLADVLAAVLGSIAPNFWSLVLFRLVNGICVSAPAALTFAYIGEFNTPTNRNRAILLMGFITGFSAIILPALAWLVLPMEWELPMYGPGLEFKPWRLLIILGSLPSLAGWASIVWFPESPKFLLALGRRKEALQVLEQIYRVNTGKTDFPVRELVEDTTSYMAGGTKMSPLALMKIVWHQTAPVFKPPFLWHTFLVCFIQFGNLASASGLLMWVPELFNYQARYSLINPGEATMCEAVSGILGNNTVAAAVAPLDLDFPDEGHLNSLVRMLLTRMGGPPSPSCEGKTIISQVYVNALIIGCFDITFPLIGSAVVNTVGKRNMLVFCMWLTGAAGIALNFVPSYAGILALVIIVIGITGTCIGHISGIVVDLFPANLRGMAVSLSLMCGRGGSMAGNFIFGSLLEQNCDSAFYFFGGVLVLCGLCACLLPKKGKYAT